MELLGLGQIFDIFSYYPLDTYIPTSKLKPKQNICGEPDLAIPLTLRQHFWFFIF